MAHPPEQQMVPSHNANALQAPAQHMMQQATESSQQPQQQQQQQPQQQGSVGPSATAKGPEPMATTHLATSLSTDMDMDNVESSADSVIALQV